MSALSLADGRKVKGDDGLTFYSSSLSPQQTADIMVSALRGTSFIPASNIKDKPEYRVGIVIRNLVTGKETLITQPSFPEPTPDFSKTWLMPYVDDPVFYNTELSTMKKPPPLVNPADQQADLCTTCLFPIGRGERLQAIAFLVYESGDVFYEYPNTKMDQVFIRVRTDQIPLSAERFAVDGAHKHRRFYALQHAFLQLAVQNPNMKIIAEHLVNPANSMTSMATALYKQAASVTLGMFDTESDSYNITFAFTVPSSERTAGSRVIPTVLQILSGLMPGLSADQAIYYDILQAHQFAYTFRLRNLAGWKILGAVNSALPDFGTVDGCFAPYAPATFRIQSLGGWRDNGTATTAIPDFDATNNRFAPYAPAMDGADPVRTSDNILCVYPKNRETITTLIAKTRAQANAASARM